MSFKVGDKVELIDHNRWTRKAGLTIGEIYTVRKVSPHSGNFYLERSKFIHLSKLFKKADSLSKISENYVI